MSFDVAEFISESNLIDRQPNYLETHWIPGAKPGDLMFDNQMNAYNLALDKVKEHNLTGSDVLDIHRELSRGVDFFELRNMSGVYRRVDVYLNSPRGRITFAPVGQLKWLMDNIWTGFYADCIKEAETADNETKERLAYEIHDLFECIHPFIDGNGRTGRILLNAARVQMGLIPVTILYNTREKYYNHINAFRNAKYDITVSKYGTPNDTKEAE
jgi:Fic family protein